MFVEQRTYTLVPGGVAEYLRLYAECGRAPQEQALGMMVGCFTTEVGPLNQLVYLWAFDSLDERARRRAALMADPAFGVFRGKVRHLLVRQENRILRQELGGLLARPQPAA
ncbi:NIPSNAP family protein [Burkholderia vietnamiensis]|uniref:NIPSNAP family protein n=1 Tax=Burkholderia vietnamiensis TaxID=60552 RepID=UPI00075A9C7E|nr:NIPSNAP family protein [Burkholderia vietnamiensis]KVS00811.1 NIPSNAP family containing protein [Burkholderia vietnamiensis]MCA7985016.1 NIPSNAP family protein [Burkholderia vietnamiensis]CAG9199308.1 NIPSNAP family containing protein [Burkholderia vietnamiensis]CAG9233659.1 NIPSNAP family containing protein [Burkholderia vietnamiensis]HDR8933277.1 NIPSNAP family protein [Burkholderia vietnamiensis]